jgi:hypothetical protein
MRCSIPQNTLLYAERWNVAFREKPAGAILEDTETELREIRPEELKYDRKIFLDGMHTYNANARYEVIDIKTRRFNILNFIMRIAGKFLRH